MISYIPVGDTTIDSQRDGFVEAYKEAFGGPPYYEHYSTDEVLDEVWNPHVKDGITILALDGNHVVGFGCALPIEKAPSDIGDFVTSQYTYGDLPIDPGKTWYMSELGVLTPYRRRGIGYALVRHRLESIVARGDVHYVFRTAAQGSNSIHLYRNLGATQLSAAQDVSATEQVTVNGSQSTARVYLYGDCKVTLENHPDIGK